MMSPVCDTRMRFRGALQIDVPVGVDISDEHLALRMQRLEQFLSTSAYWTLGYNRVPLPGVMLGIFGAAGALNLDSLVWRSLPLTPRDAGVFRWWATAGLPGLFLTLLGRIAMLILR
jgi:hypothetical protein